MRNLTISINIEYKRNRTWGWNPTATVTASLDGVRTDTTTATASGCGYDKLSTAVCGAFSRNPLLQTLLMWDGWQTATKTHGLNVVQDHEWSFGGMGMSALLRHLRANGCHVTETCDAQGDPIAYTITRDMPASFVSLI
ncbi:MAG TPA: hypothetical protein K8W03_01300 [Bifidobacterium pseudolongum subsp. globosum]|nr:hypothetical protein [Bifidobacterium pseudolongum subsp. globosum]